MRTSDNTQTKGPVENRDDTMFTGPVLGEVLLPIDDNTSVNRVTFPAGSRTFWHSHEGGQMLIGQAGSGLVVTRAGEVTAIRDGVIVHGEPGEEHWHGALPDALMTHLSVVMGGATLWGEEVSHQEYEAAVKKLP